MRSRIRRAAAIALLPLLAACANLATDYPIGGTAPDAFDTRLIGAWKIAGTEAHKDDDKGYLFVTPGKDGVLHGAVVIWGQDKADSGTFTFDAVTGRIGDDRYLNVKTIVDQGQPLPDEPKGYLPYRYSLDDAGKLVIYDHDADGLKRLADAIESNALEGIVTEKISGRDPQGRPIAETSVRVSEAPPALDTYFGANGKAVFDKPMDTFRRVTLP